MAAIGQYLRERAQQAASDEPDRQAKTVTRRGTIAQEIADQPHLTGDPEWDAIELAETDPSRPTLAERGIDLG